VVLLAPTPDERGRSTRRLGILEIRHRDRVGCLGIAGNRLSVKELQRPAAVGLAEPRAGRDRRTSDIHGFRVVAGLSMATVVTNFGAIRYRMLRFVDSRAVIVTIERRSAGIVASRTATAPKEKPVSWDTR